MMTWVEALLHRVDSGVSLGAWVGTLMCAVTTGCTPSDGEKELFSPPRAIIIVSIDTLRADHLGLYEYERFTSPALDEFGAQGVVFEDASSTTPWTLPAHASMLTGLFPLSHGVLSASTALSEEVGTLAGWFFEAGWDTAAVVNAIWLKRDSYGLTRDFEKYLFIEDADYRRRSPSRWVTDQAIEWISAQGERPLLLFVHYYDVHADYASLPEYERLLVSSYEGLADGSAWQIERANFAEAHIAYCLEKSDPAQCEFGSREKPRRIDAEMERVEFDSADVDHLEQLYDAGIRQMDSEISRFLGFLESSNRSHDSIVMITSDHGEEFMEHGRLGHSISTHQQSLRVPLLVRGPGVPAGVRISTPVSLVDLAPTVLSLAGLKASAKVDGLDISRLWRTFDSSLFDDRYLYGEASEGLQKAKGLPGVYPIYRSVRQGRFKLIQQSGVGAPKYELFDLGQDPDEQNDVMSVYPQRAATLMTELKRRHSVLSEPRNQGSEVELDESELEQLRALGYAP